MTTLSAPQVTELKLKANEMRHDIIRMLEASASGHPGGSLSVTDILATLLFSGVMPYNPDDPKDPNRDRLFLSKGHVAPALYVAYKQIGWVADREITTLRKLGSRLQGHPNSVDLPCLEVSSGSLGQGLSISCGCALGLKVDQKRADAAEVPHVWCITGDGELQEGSNWEALMFGAHQCLDNVTLIVDLNNLQIDGHVSDVNSLGDIDAKLRAFGWDVQHVNGHDVQALHDAFVRARAHKGSPSAVVCDTVKGKGVSFMEDKAAWHGTAPNHEQAEQAISELDAERAKIEKGANDGQ